MQTPVSSNPYFPKSIQNAAAFNDIIKGIQARDRDRSAGAGGVRRENGGPGDIPFAVMPASYKVQPPVTDAA
jgi:hypothetical protein